MQKLNICIAGLGNVGSHLIYTIEENSKFIKSKASLKFDILGISAKNKSKKRIFNKNLYNWCENPLDLLNINKCQVLIELIGQEKGISYQLIKKALQKRIHVITANKALLAKNGSELFKIAEKNKTLLLYEAAVAGGIPIIKILKNNIFLNKIEKISGILNGTTNYILTKMKEENLSFNKVLKIALSKGYTSQDEIKLDIGGLDSAHKLTLLSTLAFGTKVKFSNNYINGIENINIEDIMHANKLGYSIKLISESSLINNRIFSITEPKLIKKENPMAKVNGVLNAINIKTDQLQSLFIEGEGAGGRATASSVISDLYEIFYNSDNPSLGYSTAKLQDYNKINLLNIRSAFYIRIMTKDLAGVLSKITGFFKDQKISIEKIMQLPDKNTNINNIVPIIITTHKTKKDIIMKAIKKIQKQKFILEKISIIPIDSN